MARLFALLAMLAFVPSAFGQHCYHNNYVQTYQTPTIVTPVVQAIFVPVATYSVGYAAPVVAQPVAPTLAAPAPVAAPVSNCDAMAGVMKELLGEVRAMRAERQQPQQPVPLMAPKQSQAEPDGIEGAALAGVNVFATRCASCHERATAGSKGGGFVLTDAGKVAPLTADQREHILREIRTGAMPKQGKLSPDEFNAIASWFVATAK